MKTLVIGASEKPERYANQAVRLLLEKGHEVAAVGRREGTIEGVPIWTGHPMVEAVETISLYVGSRNQAGLVDYMLNLNPRRVIFNPGTENEGLEKQLQDAGVETMEACTLVMLRTGQW